MVVIVALALGLALAIQAWVVKPYQIPSGSMEPTLDVGQRVLVNRFIYHLHEPKAGDIVVFHPPAGAETAAECGVDVSEREACPKPTAGRVEPELHQADRRRRRRHALDQGRPPGRERGREDATSPTSGPAGRVSVCNLPKTITIPKGYFFMMGDNRGDSDDSRYWGPVPKAWIIGEAFATYWPPDRIGTL